MARPGRKRRDPLAPQEPKGPDRGTQELQLQRLKAVRGGDPTLATEPLDVLFARRQITLCQQMSGQVYGLMQRRLFGKGCPSIASYDELIHSFSLGWGDGDEAHRRRVFEDADDALKAVGELPRFAARRLILDRVMLPEAGLSHASYGLKALAKHFCFR